MAMADNPLKPVFNARSIAVIGASADPLKRGNQAIRKLLDDGYDGAIYPINPKAAEILGLRAYPTLSDVDDDIDLALICTPAASVPAMLAQCGAKGIAGAVVLAAGFSELGDEGADISRDTLEAARAHGVRVVGPNTNGIFNLHNTMNLVGVQGVEPGAIGVCSQSGNMMLSFVTEAKRRGGVGFSTYVGVGNQLDLSLADYLEYFDSDANTKASLFYVEGFQDGRRFLDVCRRVSQNKPVVIYKSGRTEAGQVAARSHTGALASSFALTRGLLTQAGATVIENSEKLLSVAEGLSKMKVPRGGRVAILADGGGHATVTVDALVDSGVDLAHLSADTVQRLRAILPSVASTVNPVDVAGGTDDNPGRAADCAQIILEDDGVDILMIVGMFGGFADRFNPSLLDNEIEASRRLARIAETSGKPLLVQSVYSALRTQPIEILKELGVPVFVWPEPAARCVAELIGYARARARIQSFPPVLPEGRNERAAAIIATALNDQRDALYEHEGMDLLASHGIRVPGHVLARSADELRAATSDLGDRPMAMKIVSKDILHKSDAKGVKLGLKGEAALADGYAEMLRQVGEARPDAQIHGVLVTPMAAPGVEVIVGVIRDPTFGPVMMFGLGGIFVEVLKDVAFRALPMSRADAREMIDEIKARAILDGVRGAKPVDLEALIDLMIGVSQIALEHPEIAEIDLNPIIVRNDGYDVVDARMILGGQAK